jgi:hypothetical protein
MGRDKARKRAMRWLRRAEHQYDMGHWQAAKASAAVARAWAVLASGVNQEP